MAPVVFGPIFPVFAHFGQLQLCKMHNSVLKRIAEKGDEEALSRLNKGERNCERIVRKNGLKIGGHEKQRLASGCFCLLTIWEWGMAFPSPPMMMRPFVEGGFARYLCANCTARREKAKGKGGTEEDGDGPLGKN